jgi:signal transduction histidine kinase
MDSAVPVPRDLLVGSGTRRAHLAAWAVFTLALTAAAAGIAATGPNGTALTALGRGLIVALPLGAGLYTWLSGNQPRFGLLLAATGMAAFVTTLAETDDAVLYSIGRAAGWLVEVLIVYLVLAFPTGRLHERVDRLLFAAMSGVVTVLFLPRLILGDDFALPSPYTSCTNDCPENAFFAFGSEPAVVDAFLKPAGLLLIVAVATAVLIRLRQRVQGASLLARRAVTPVLAVGVARTALLAAGFIVRDLEPTAWPVEVTSWLIAACLPAIALAFLAGTFRWRLYAGDALERLAQGLTTGHSAAGLEPTMADAFRDPTLEIAFPADTAGTWMDSLGRPLAPPVPTPARSVSEVRHDGSLVAAVVHDAALDSNRRLLDAGINMAGLALDNHRLALEANTARRRQREASARVAANEARERRRIERDLHDGAQQRLVAIGIELELAQELAERDPAGTAARLRKLRVQTGEALDEIRALAHGVSPPLLADRGLVEALRGVAARSPIKVEIEADGVGRMRPEVESALYFCVLEAIQNTLKHAEDARRIEVRLEVTAGELRFMVRDDGAGAPGGVLRPGRGITNMDDRLAAVGGRLELSTAVAVGTAVRGRVPLEQPS